MKAVRACALIIGLAAALLPLPSVHGLECVEPPEWAELQVVDSDERDVLARVPFTGHIPGYDCNIGNLHALGGPWLAWMEPIRTDHWAVEPGAHHPGPVRILSLEDGSRGSMSAPTKEPVHGMSVASGPEGSPIVYLLTRGDDEGTWVLHGLHPGLGPDPGALGGQVDEPLTLAADQAILHGTYVALLADDNSARPHIIVRDIDTGRHLHEGNLIPPPGMAPPWIILDANEHWIIVAAGERNSVDGDVFLPPETDAWAYRVRDGTARRVPSAMYDDGDELQPASHGAYRLDQSMLYRAIWQPGLPWGPAKIEIMPMPPAGSERGSAGGLMTGIEVDGGRLVLGTYLRSGPPENTVAWLDPGAAKPRPAPAAEVPGIGPLVALAIVVGSFLVRRHHSQCGAARHNGRHKEITDGRDNKSLHPTAFGGG